MSAPRGQRGMALLSVIMVMLVLASIAAYLAEAISGRHAAGALAVLQRQADHAAQAGIEWARDRALVGGSCANAQIAYAGMTVDVSCATVQVNENGVLYAVFDVAADARHGSYGNADFVRRTRRARLAAR
jgi:type II secretory pathway pseudopilin PulG